jgi:hypothetical protein
MARLDGIFSVTYGKKFDFNKMTPDPDGVAFVGRQRGGQGIAGHVARVPDVEPNPTGSLTVALGGSYVLASFVQQGPFYTGQNVAVLTPIDGEMPLAHRLFYSMCIEANRYRYAAFGREANRTLKTLQLPDSVPAWVDDVEIPDLPRMSSPANAPVALRPASSWAEFKLGDLFNIAKGSRLTRRSMLPGRTPYIGSSAVNNGVTQWISKEQQFPGGVLTVPYNGSVGHAFYQPTPFCAGDDVHVLAPVNGADEYALMFVAGAIRHEKYRFNYGRKWHLDRMRASVIRLPRVPESGIDIPDWQYMSTYIRGLNFSQSVADEVPELATSK